MDFCAIPDVISLLFWLYMASYRTWLGLSISGIDSSARGMYLVHLSLLQN